MVHYFHFGPVCWSRGHKKYKNLGLSTKVDIIRQKDASEKKVSAAKVFEIPHYTLSMILRHIANVELKAMQSHLRGACSVCFLI